MITAQEYAKSGKVDQATAIGILLATAQTGEAWGKLPAAEKTYEKAQELIESAPLRPDNNFLEAAGTRELAVNYSRNLIGRSAKLDEEQKLAKGTNLLAYMDKAASAIEGVDIEKAKMGLVPKEKLQAVREKFAEASRANLGTKEVLEKDFIHALQTDPEISKDKDGKPITVEPKEMGGGFMEMLLKLIGMLLGIDLAGLFAGPQPSPEARGAAEREGVALTHKDTEEKLNALIPAAKALRSGENIEANTATVKSLVVELGGTVDENRFANLTKEQAGKLGQEVLDDVTKIRTGQMKPEELGAQLSQSLASAEKPKENTLPAFEGLSQGVLASVAMVGRAVFPVISSVAHVATEAAGLLSADTKNAKGGKTNERS
jgi:hypothetical protein